MSQGLRERLAWLLAEVSNQDGPEGEGWNMSSETTDAGWLYAADEVIRQMEWARHTVAKASHDTYKTPYGWLTSEMVPITLAPKDWHP